MGSKLLDKAVRRIGIDDATVSKLVAARAGDLQSVMLDVMRERTLAQRPRDVARAFSRRFCVPGRVDPRLMLRVDGALFDALGDGFELLELGPVAPLGCCSVVAPCDPGKVLATVRNLEVTSDPSNVLALEAARRRDRGEGRADLAASHRALRVQVFDNPDFHAHFRLFALVSMFPSRGSGRAELTTLIEHLEVYRRLASLLPGGALERVSFSAAGQPWLTIRDGAHHHLRAAGIPTDDEDSRIGSNAYYQGLSFVGAFRTPAGRVIPMIDGGFTDWGAKLTSRSRERTLVSAIGSELLARDLAARDAGA